MDFTNSTKPAPTLDFKDDDCINKMRTVVLLSKMCLLQNLKVMAVACAGGGVVDALLAAGNKNVRAVTRNSTSKKAKDLATRGVEVVEGDLGDTASLLKVWPWTS